MNRYFSLFLLIFLSTNCSFSEKLEESSITIIGGAQGVSGSCYLLETNEKNLLIDCGLFYPESQELGYETDIGLTTRLNTKLPISPNRVSSILITHAHLDHIGKIPLLVKNGYKGELISTMKTKELSLIMFEMLLKSTSLGNENFIKSSKSKKVHSQEVCKWQQKIKNKKKLSIERNELFDTGFQLCKECLNIEVGKIERLFKTYSYNKKIDISRNISAEFFDAKHIPGSSSIMIYLNQNNGQKKILFSGDVGSGLDNLMKGNPNTPLYADYIFLESTYGAKKRDIPNTPFKDFYRDLNNALINKKIVWIPSFVLDRTQKVLNTIKAGQSTGDLPSAIDIKVLSSTAKKINSVYDKYYDYRPRIIDESLSMSPKKLEDQLFGPKIFLTPSYVDGIEFFHPIVKRILTDKRSEVMMVGYQDPRSFGGILKNLSKGSRIRLSDENFKVSANVKYYSGVFSGHFDLNGIKNYLSSINITKTIFLVHGDASSKRELKAVLSNLYGDQIVIPLPETKISIKNNAKIDISHDIGKVQYFENKSSIKTKKAIEPKVFITRTGKKYHLNGCKWLKSKIPSTVADASAKGLKPCKVCKPPQANN